MEKINIAIADDNERMQEMLGNVIKQDDTLELIGQTGRPETEMISTVSSATKNRTSYCLTFSCRRWMV